MKKIILILFIIPAFFKSQAQTPIVPDNITCETATQLCHPVTYNYDDTNPGAVTCQHTPFALWYSFYHSTNNTLGRFHIQSSVNINQLIMYGPFASTDLATACQSITANTAPIVNYSTAPATLPSGNFDVVVSSMQKGFYVFVVKPATCQLQITFGELVGIECIPADPTTCKDCLGTFSPIPGKKYVLSGWVKEENAATTVTTYNNPQVVLSFATTGPTVTLTPFVAKGQIIDGWQRIEEVFTVPSNYTSINIQLNVLAGNGFFDDIRVFPFDGMMETYVYDPVSLRLVAQLDERHYSTLYEYDEEGKLVRVKKETEKGIMTIEETKRNAPKH